ncbi:uncharacterized protein BX664DRAFT_106769 [Halteromyces radiatus]|uniref:uncharacterized protein n=1 Tax=Halteromyces radiatus TaxID=101107 RepID=UPI00221FA6B1|nr:uncharacterized protein BX664DRAFT_106769 [Halteromyces radiatus]KAI8093408.1 hypothetical protein BX664DRAFT_106769 [Halteromyces radiatus]
MKHLFLLSIFIFSFISLISADSTYIVALKKQVDTDQVDQAISDIKSVGGKILYEIKTGNKAFIVSLPDDQYSVMETKDYVDFVEADQESVLLTFFSFFSAHLKRNQSYAHYAGGREINDLSFTLLVSYRY